MKKNKNTDEILPTLDTIRIFILNLGIRNTTEYNKTKPNKYPHSRELKELYGITFSEMAFRRGRLKFNFRRQK